MDEKKKEVLGKQWLHEAWGWIVRHMSTTPREMLRGLVAALIAFLLANCELPFSVYPLGLAFLCASTEGTLYIMAGLVAASFTLPLPRALSLCVAVGTVIIRILARVFIDLPNRIGGDGRRGEIREYLRGRMFCEGLYLRMACSCVSVFAMSLGAIVGGGFRYYDLFGALLSMVMAPMAVRLFSGVFSGETDSPFSGRMAVAARHLSHVSVCAALCLSLRNVSLLGVPLSVVFAFVATLSLVGKRGLAVGMIGGLLCGLAIDPPYALMFGVAAFAAFCVQDRAPTLAAAVACLAATVCGFFLPAGGTGTVFLPLFFGMAVYSAARRVGVRLGATVAPVAVNVKEDQFAAVQTRARRMADSLSELSAALLSLSKQHKAVSEAPSGEEVEADLRNAEAAEIFALDYAASASLLRGLFSDGETAFCEDEKNAAAILARLKVLGCAVSDVHVTGARQKRIVLLGAEGWAEKVSMEYLREQMREVCGFPVSLPALSDGRVTAVRGNLLSATFGSAYRAEESVCGDVISVFRDEERGYLFALLNDGMGAGREAAFTARLASLFLRKLLPTGVDIETALRMLHHFLRLGHNRGGHENSTTVDLLALDLVEGRASFVKSGAAPTYIKRGKHIFCIRSDTVPVGILPEMDAKQIEFDVRDGDMVVMVSDGVASGEGECPWLSELPSDGETQSPAAVAEGILSAAAQSNPADDLSAIVLCIKHAS